MLTTIEASKQLGITASQVQRLCRQGRLPGAIQHSRAWWIPLTAIRVYEQTRPVAGWPKGRPRIPKQESLE